MARILAHGALRDRDMPADARWDHRVAYEAAGSSSSASPALPGYGPPHGGHGHGEMGLGRSSRYTGGHGGLARGGGGGGGGPHVAAHYAHQLAYYSDALTGERGLQEAIEQSKKAHLMRELPREKYHPERHKGLVECELCLMDYDTGDELMRLPCLHLFHSQCVSPWLHKSYTCPVCQTDVCEAVGL